MNTRPGMPRQLAQDSVAVAAPAGVVALAALFAVGGCGDAGPRGATVTIADSAGLVVVTNTGAAEDTVRAVTAEKQIGDVGLDGPEEYTFHLVSDIAVLEDARVVVIDNRAGRIALFRADGGWLGDLGGRGRGPGEHEAPIRVSRMGDTLFVWDSLLRRLNRYHAGTGFLDAVQLRDRAGGLPIAVVPGGIIDEVEWGQYMDPEPAAGALLLRDRDGVMVDTLAEPFPVPEYGWEWVVEGQTGMMVNPPALSVRPAWTVRGGDLIRVRPGTATLEVWDVANRELGRLIRLDRPVGPPSASDREAHLDALNAERPRTPEQQANLRENTVWADVRPPITGLLADDEARIWVAEHDPGQRPGRRHLSSSWDLLDPEGRLVTHVVFPSDFHLMAVHRGCAYGLRTDEDGVQSVAVYRLGERDPG